MDECIFCKIAENIITSYKIYEDEDIVCVLNIFPVNPGHLIIFPRKHCEDLNSLDDGIYVKMLVLAKKLSEVLKIIFNTNKIVILLYLNKDYEKTRHISIEIFPRFDGDDVKLILPRKKADSLELENLKSKIVSMIFVKKEEEIKTETKDKIDLENFLKWLRKNI
ncbi:MAG: HIT family protein [Nanopusillaceae archaeon]